MADRFVLYCNNHYLVLRGSLSFLGDWWSLTKCLGIHCFHEVLKLEGLIEYLAHCHSNRTAQLKIIIDSIRPPGIETDNRPGQILNSSCSCSACLNTIKKNKLPFFFKKTRKERNRIDHPVVPSKFQYKELIYIKNRCQICFNRCHPMCLLQICNTNKLRPFICGDKLGQLGSPLLSSLTSTYMALP